MPRAWHEAAGWVVREGVTNVLRHSDASFVEITYTDGELRLENDGAHAGDAAGSGSGLTGLSERLAPLGASLLARPDGDGRWVVLARLPGSGPISSNHKEGRLP
jgi:two-component system sensor histidine kinase DesK